MATYTERLALVRSAIDEILTGAQAVSYEGRSLSMANLAELRKLEIDYQNEATKEIACKTGRNRIVYVTPVT